MTHDDRCESELTSHGRSPCRCVERATVAADVKEMIRIVNSIAREPLEIVTGLRFDADGQLLPTTPIDVTGSTDVADAAWARYLDAWRARLTAFVAGLRALRQTQQETLRLTVPEVMPFVVAHYDAFDQPTGGLLHIVLDDGNLEDGNITFCAEQANAANDAWTVQLCELLLNLTLTQRRRVYHLLWHDDRHRWMIYGWRPESTGLR